ncbi:tetratricopeptide repeat protein, partial [Acinetobacter ursingii]|uniref:tetratricopeptide repeat protein n=1 Tax=Acinetobacter ursingii TaxID=108980 RepID=UPI00370C6A26
KKLNEKQASLDATDLLMEFAKKLSEEDIEVFTDMLYEERSALLPSVDDQSKELSKKAEAKNYHLQAQFIFSELSANLTVYGSNSSLTGANPANVELALDYINRSLEIDPNNPVYLNLKGLLLWQGKKDKVAALPLIEKAAKLDPSNITIQHNLKAIEDPKGCFIATAAFGTPVAYEINELRYWRDTTLSKNIYGIVFIKIYYKVSPSIASLIATRPKVKKVIRKLLQPIIRQVRLHNQK